MMECVIIAAVAANGVIGKDGDIPWESIPEDHEQYRARIADAPVILGRRTFEMFDDLPGRVQIVLSRNERDFEAPTAVHASGVEDAIAIAESYDADCAYVIGGAGIYELFQPHLDRMVLSRIPGTYEGDAYYPEWDENQWVLDAEVSYAAFTLQEWNRSESG